MINTIKYFFKRKRNVYDVFTPSSEAKLTFVNRKKSEEDLLHSLNTPGLQLIIYGYTGCGKTTLSVNKLSSLGRKFITTRCEDGTTLESVLLNAFDSLNPYFVDERNSKVSTKISNEVKVNYKIIEGKIAGEISAEDGAKLKRVLPPQLTPQRLADFFGEADCSWIIEDFHKVQIDQKKRLSQIMKIFMDTGTKYKNTKIICIGAVGTAREVLEYDKELNNRIAEINVPLMTPSEITEIIEKGESILNIKFEENVKSRIVNLSNGLPSVCHHICLNMCVSKGVDKTKLHTVKLSSEELNKAVEKYINDKSDTFKAVYDEAVKVHRTSKFENGKLILNAMISLNKEELTHNEILTEIRKTEPQYPSSNLTIYLKNLITVDKNEVILYDEAANKFSFKNPFFKVYALMRLTSQPNEQGTWDEKNIIQGNANIVVQNTISGGNIIIGDSHRTDK